MIKWLKKKILKWLGLDYEICMGMDVGYKSNSAIIIIKWQKDGSIKVIADHEIESRGYQELMYKAREIARKYRCKNIVVDKPRGFPY